MIYSEPVWRRFDYVLFGVTILLIIFGVLMIASATQDAIDPTLISRVPDQIRFAILGIFFMVGLSLMDYRLLSGLNTWLYILMVILLLMVFAFGVVGDAGAQSWINIGIRIQPSEVAKVLIIITLAHYLSRNYDRLDRLSTLVVSLLHMGNPSLFDFYSTGPGHGHCVRGDLDDDGVGGGVAHETYRDLWPGDDAGRWGSLAASV